MTSQVLLIRFEILLLIVSFSYILYYFFSVFNKTFFKVRKALKKEDISNVKVALNKVDLWAKEDNYAKASNKKKLTNEEQKQVIEILKKVRIKSWNKFYTEAKALIIEWLAIDKYNKDLNLELANIYELEWNYLNSEYIYKDLLEISKNDFEVNKKLWYSYYMQWKLSEAYSEYLKVNKKLPWDEEVLKMLSEISYDMKEYKTAVKFLNDYIKYKPRDVDKLTMKAISQEELRDFKDAILTYKKILEIQPYNTYARDRSRELISLWY